MSDVKVIVYMQVGDSGVHEVGSASVTPDTVHVVVPALFNHIANTWDAEYKETK